ncbi:hypothetical protein B0H16DRAFT_1751760 [Mycena metata]|uniref:Uncharacterized protein n=1 Tax=Mycena metata TaxID=1033252 RepID=A0AAD7DJM0_9AGAR|nr:hypothetical protein B0H16DRAFT_1751760 [Mycena metata]
MVVVFKFPGAKSILILQLHRSLNSPFHSLSTDVLGCVFVHFLGPFGVDPIGYEEAKTVASLVSKGWLQTLRSVPVLWSAVLIDNYTDQDVLCSGLDRSGVLPLHIRFDLVPRDLLHPTISSAPKVCSFIQRTLNNLAPYLHRCNSLDLKTGDATTTSILLLSLAPVSFPGLSHLQLDLHYSPLPTAHTLLAFPPGALLRLDVVGGFIELRPAVYAALSTLVMRGRLYTRWPHFVECLSCVTRLSSLEFYDVSCIGASSCKWVLDQPTLVLPSVRHFALSATFVPSVWIVGILRFPFLESFKLAVVDPSVLATVASMGITTFSSVRRFELSAPSYSPFALGSLVAPMTSLVSLDASASHPSIAATFLVAVDTTIHLPPSCEVIRLPRQDASFGQHVLDLLTPSTCPRTWFLSQSSGAFIRITAYPVISFVRSSHDESLTYFSAQ